MNVDSGQSEKQREITMMLLEDGRGEFPDLHTLELPPELLRLYGTGLEFVRSPEGMTVPLTFVNFVVSKEGIYNLKDRPGGGAISGGNRADAFGMAIFRAAADAVMVGSGTVNGEPKHLWNLDFIFDKFPQMQGLEELRAAFHRFRKGLAKKDKNPPTFFMTNSGDVNLDAVVFHDETTSTYIVTGAQGAENLARKYPDLASRRPKVLVYGMETLDEPAMMTDLRGRFNIKHLLHEGGPRVVNALMQKGLVHQFFLTQMKQSPAGNLSPEIAQYLFSTPGHTIPPEAKIVTTRRDATGNATLYNLDFRAVKQL